MMASSSNFLDEIRAALDSAGNADPDLLIDVATEYAEACAELNRRLRDISVLLSKGLRNEAFQLAEREPSVLEEVARLDFAEREEWSGLLLNVGISTPPPLALDIAEALDEAYALHLPIDHLLKKHRLLALARAPLSARIHVLRQIIAKDPSNPAWRSDLAEWERMRLKQIPGELQQAVTQEDLAKVTQLQDELSVKGWTVEAAKEWLDLTVKGRRKVEIADARRKLQAIAKTLNDSLVALDVNAGRNARQHWQTYAAVAQLDQSDPLFAAAEEPLIWLQEEDQRKQQDAEYNSYVHRIEIGIDKGLPVAEIERLLYAVRRLDRDLPEILQLRVNEYCASREASSRRKTIAIVAAVALLIIGSGSAIYLYLNSAIHSRKVANAAAELSTLLAADELSKAERLAADMPDKIRAHPQVSSEIEKLEAALRNELDRRQAYVRNLERAKTTDVAELDSNLIDEARKFAKGEAEIRELDDLERQIHDYHLGLQEKRNVVFLQELEDFRTKVLAIEQVGSSNIVALTNLQDEIRGWKEKNMGYLKGTDKVSPSLLRQVDPLITRLTGRISLSKEQQAKMGRLSQISVTNGFASFTSELKKFCNDYPSSPLKPDFLASIDEQDCWLGYDAWRDLLKQSNWSMISTFSSAEAKSLIDSAEMLKAKHPEIWLKEHWNDKADYLASILQRGGNADDDDLVAALTELFKERAISGSYLAFEKDRPQKWYLLPFKPETFETEGADMELEYYTGVDLLTAKLKIRKEFKPKFAIVPSPQSVVAKKVLVELESLQKGTKNWESAFLQMFELLAVDGQEQMKPIDPVLRILLLKHVVKKGCQGSSILKSTFARELAALENPSVDLTANWIDAADAAAESSRQRAAAFLVGELKLDRAKLKSAGETMLAGLKKLQAEPADLAMRPVGWLYKDPSGNWDVSQLAADSNSDLFCIHPSDGGSKKVVATQFGRFEAGRLKVSKQNVLQAGRPVFISVVPGSKTSSRNVDFSFQYSFAIPK